MSGFGAFGGFGQNNANQQAGATGFGAFGSTASTNPGFGTGSTGFGSSGFGNTSAFGNTATNVFGATKPSAFGTTAPAGGGLFGNSSTTTGSAFGSGAFGSTTAAPTSAFGASNNGTGLFGGTTNTPFGGTATTTSAFGAPAQTTNTQTNIGECQGTGSVPFQAYVEKEPNSSTNQQNSFQNIAFQTPYLKYSMEELRLADYNQGRRFGNGSNQPGAFGQTNFGSFRTNNTGFGTTTNTTGGNMFGSNTTSSPFGTNQQASTGFGTTNTSNGTGLFGAKPATTGLFGSQTLGQQSGGLFGNSTNTGFGSTNTNAFNSNNTNGSVFGQNSASKPFSFGTPSGNTTTNAFGTSTTTGGFGSTGIFGNNNQQQSSSTGFGSQPVTTNAFSGFGTNNQQTATTSLFGSNQVKPAGGLFGASAASTNPTGLFGNTPSTTTTNLFGASNTNQNNGGLFGTKPAATGTDNIFGSITNTSGSTGGNMFGSFGNQNQQTTGLFGSLGNNNQQKPSIFGASQPAGGNNVFGNTGTQQQNPLFGGFNNNQSQQLQQNQNSIFGSTNSLFNVSTQNQQTPQSLTASISDNTAYGTQSLFSNLAAAQVVNPGPIATPLSVGRSPAVSKNAAIPLYQLNSGSASRFSTPQKRGFGFSYSTYGSPSSTSSIVSMPGGLSNSNMLGNSFSRTLSKSISTSSLRRSFNAEDSILAPGAFSASPSTRSLSSTGSVKKLNINRNVRSDLFTPTAPLPQAPSAPTPSGILKKHVSFDANVNGNTNTKSSGALSPLKQVNTATPTSTDLGYMRPHSSVNSNSTLSLTTTSTDVDPVPNNSNQLAIVREEETLDSGDTSTSKSMRDKKPGEYWMSPSKAKLESLNRVQRQRVSDLTVGRYGVGSVHFDVPVDLTSINLDDIMGGIVKIEVRQVTVYPDYYKKPIMGKGLNVPSTITLENSWPRKRDRKTPLTDESGKRLEKHINKLKKVQDTEFISYDKSNGKWTFRVPHFTTYGLPEEEEDEDETGDSEFLSNGLQTPNFDDFIQSTTSISQATQSEFAPEDTFEFKKSKKIIPGTFDNRDVYEDPEDLYETYDQESYVDDHCIKSRSENGTEESTDIDEIMEDESISIMDQEMIGGFIEPAKSLLLIEQNNGDTHSISVNKSSDSLQRLNSEELVNYRSPFNPKFLHCDNWVSALQATVSPKKRDRALLKSFLQSEDNETQQYDSGIMSTRHNAFLDGRGFSTSIDLMNSLFGQVSSPERAVDGPRKNKGFEWQLTKRSEKTENESFQKDDVESMFHYSMKPRWGADGTLIYAAPILGKGLLAKNDILTGLNRVIVSEHRDIRFSKFSNEASADLIKKHREITVIDDSDEVPMAVLLDNLIFTDFCDDNAPDNEKLLWQLANILWDPIEVPNELCEIPHITSSIRKDNLSKFWEELVNEASSRQVALAKSFEEKAIGCLSGHKIDDACSNLIKAGNIRVSTLVAQIGSKDCIKKDMRAQLDSWQKTKMLSEMTQPIRAIYELLAGNVCLCSEVKGPSEDRVESLSISKRFGLNWRQALGLRLWYGTSNKESIEAAVDSFSNDLSSQIEESWPSPWYVEQNVPTIWKDPNINQREDLLWGMLRLYTFENADLEDFLCPENSQLSPMDFRLSWQLSQAIISLGSIKFTGNNDEKIDRITLSFASQLVNEGNWLDAIFVLLHLTSSDTRKIAIKDNLARNAGRIGSENSPNFNILTKKYKLPASWVWEAKALYMRSAQKNPRDEVECLIKAGFFNEAHRTFSRDVAPKTIVDLDYKSLDLLLKGFAGKELTILDWKLGGGLYTDFLKFVESEEKGQPTDESILERLLSVLPSVLVEVRHPSFMETVAIQTMSDAVASTVLNIEKNGMKNYLAKIPNLSLTEDKCLKYSMELSSRYYRDRIIECR